MFYYQYEARFETLAVDDDCCGHFAAAWVGVLAAMNLQSLLLTVNTFFSYMILPVVLSDANDTVRIDQTASTVVALFFIGVGYAASIAIAFVQRRKKMFLLRSVLVSVKFFLFAVPHN